MDKKKIMYWVPTVLMCGIFAFSAQMYFFKTEMVRGFFEQLGFPVWVIIPLAFAKIFGIITILSNFNRAVSEWVYAGFFFNAVLATAAHYYAGHGMIGLSFYALVLVLLSRGFWSFRNIRGEK